MGINTTAHVGISPPVWAGIMSAQSGAAMPWYWDTIDPNNDYFLLKSAADFVTVSGLADQNILAKSSPRMTGGTVSSLVFAPGGGFETNKGPDVFTVGSAAPDGIGASTVFLQGNGNRSLLTNGYTFLVDYVSNGTFSVQINQVSACGGTLQIIRDGAIQTNVVFAGNATCGSTYVPGNVNQTYTITVTAGAHTIKLANPGNDWITLGNITLNPYVPMLAAYAIGNTNFAAMWLWHRTNVFRATPGPAITGTVDIAGLDVGTYSGVWWDTFGAGAISNFTFTVAATNVPVTLNTPVVLRSLALYAGAPPRAQIISSNLTPIVVSNAPPFNLPVVITNSGGLPLAYSLSFTSAIPTWLSFSSTNGYVPKSGSVAVYLAFNAAGLSAGAYPFTLFINTGDATLPVTTLPVSLTIPAVPRLVVLSASSGEFVFQIQGSTNVPYEIQHSSDLVAWNSVSTNTLPGGILNITNSIAAGSAGEFWRALWRP
ncbi:MAG: hypothetical protein ABJC04_07685 [Verrucomicrobiota bacterium]